MNATTIARPPLIADDERDLACETLYRFLAAALSDPRRESCAILFDPASQELVGQATDLLRAEFEAQAIPLGFGELPAEDLDLHLLVAQLPSCPNELGDEYVRVFGLANCRECPPYETEYHPNEDTFFRSQQMADIAGFYRAFGLEPGSAARERPDFLGLELEFNAFLLLKKRQARKASPTTDQAEELAAVCQAGRMSFLRDHLSWWVPSFALALRTKAGSGFYELVGRVLSALMPIERHCFGVAAPKMPLQASFSETPEECAGCLASIGP